MQRRSLRGRIDVAQVPEEPEATTVTEPTATTATPTEPPPKRRPGRPRRSSIPKPEPEPPKNDPPPSDVNVVLNARGMPARQRKRNRYYEDDEEEKTPVQRSKLSEKNIKIEPLQILLDNPANSLKVTPIISEASGEEVPAPIQAKKTVVKLVMPTKVKVEPPGTPEGQRIDPLTVGSKSSIPKVATSKPNISKYTSPKPELTKLEAKPEFPKLDFYKRSDYSSFIRFFANVKTRVIMPDRWGINGVMFDPVRKMKTFTMCEMEISPLGDARIKKCIQVFEDLSLRFVIHGQDLTGKIEGLKRLQSESDVPGIVSKICALKVCTGVKTFGPQDLIYHPTANKKGSCYFSAECQTVLSFNYVGALCPPCNKLRNAVRRRKLKTKQDRDKAAAKPNVKKVPSMFGRAMYSLLDQLITDDKSKKPANLKTGKDGLSFPEIKLEPGSVGLNGRRRSGTAQKTQRKVRASDQKPRKRKTSGNTRGTPLAVSHVIDPATGLRQAVLPQGIMDYLTIGGDTGNIVIQNGGEFTLADGQEYELIGEADPADPMHVVQTPEEQTIQIIEVDDQTMAQFAQNINMSGMFFHDPSNIQVTEIDPNDPNTVFKVLNPGEIILQDHKV